LFQILAEVQAILHDYQACLKALSDAEKFFEGVRHSPDEETSWLRFDRSRLEGYKGSCFKRLYCPGDDRAKAYLVDAQRTLTSALEHLAPTKLQRRSVLALDLASVCANQGAVEAACLHAAHALSITTQTQSQTVLQRLFVLRQELEPWKDTPDVKNLDGLIRPLLISALRFPA
jgi:hypothetical protein